MSFRPTLDYDTPKPKRERKWPYRLIGVVGIITTPLFLYQEITDPSLHDKPLSIFGQICMIGMSLLCLTAPSFKKRR